MLVVVFDWITSTAEHLTASGIGIILTFLLSSPTIFIFCWSIREADGPRPCPPKVYFSCSLWNRSVFFVFFLISTLSIALILERKKVVTCSGDSVLLVFFAKCLLKVSKMQTIIFGIVCVSLKFNFKSVKMHCFVIHYPIENLVALVCGKWKVSSDFMVARKKWCKPLWCSAKVLGLQFICSSFWFTLALGI